MKVYMLICEPRDLITWAPVADVMRHYPGLTPVVWLATEDPIVSARISERLSGIPLESIEQEAQSTTDETAVILVRSSQSTAAKVQACKSSGLPIAVLDMSPEGTDPGQITHIAHLCFAVTREALLHIRHSTSAPVHLTGHPAFETLEVPQSQGTFSHPALLRGKEGAETAKHDSTQGDGLAAMRIAEIIVHTFAPENDAS